MQQIHILYVVDLSVGLMCWTGGGDDSAASTLMVVVATVTTATAAVVEMYIQDTENGAYTQYTHPIYLTYINIYIIQPIYVHKYMV